jgi:cytochrome c nitrite reductase small subunit
VILALGVLAGMGLAIAHVSNAVSYLSDEPRTCVNCHVMAPEYATWTHGSHGRVAVCTDCHVPHDSVIRKYGFKAADGMRHSAVFTLRMEPQVIQIKDAGRAAVQANCIRCHETLLDRVSLRAERAGPRHVGDGRVCWECHRETPHGRVASLASAPYARVPRLAPVMPEWMASFLEARR